MYTKEIHLKELYPFLDNGLADPVLEINLQSVYPARKDEKRPAIIVLPGGGYSGLAPHEGWPLAFEYMSIGFNGFVLNYSTNREDLQNTYPQQILEIACALDYINQNADEFCVDMNKIAITGSSAGGHAAASYCTLRNRPEITKHINPLPVAAAILNYPVISGISETHAGSFQHLLGKKGSSDEERSYVSCELHVDPSITPPTFIWASFDDATVPVSNSLRYVNALNQAKIPFELHIFPYGGHGQASGAHFTSAIQDREVARLISQWVPAVKGWLCRLFDLR